MPIATAALTCAIVFLAVLIFSVAFLLFTVRLPVYHPLILFSVYFFVGYFVAAVSIWWNDGSYLWEHTGISPNGLDVLYAGTLATLGYLSFTFLPLLFRASRPIPLRIAPLKLVIGSPLRFWFTFAILSVLGIAATKVAFFNFSDLSQGSTVVVSVDDQGGQRLVDVSGYQLMPSNYLAVLCVVLFLTLHRISISFVALSAFVAVRMFIGTDRSAFVAAIFGMVVAIMIRKGARVIRVHHFALLILIAVVFDWLGTNRLFFKEMLFPDQITIADVASDNTLGWTSVRQSSPLSDMYDFASLTMVSKVVPELTGFNWGSQYLAGFIWPIPRQLWPDKPVFTGRINLMNVGNFFGQTISSMGDAYTNFGLMSLVLLMGVFGACSCKLYEVAANGKSAITLMSFVIFVMYAPILFRSSIVQFEYFFIASISCVYILFKLGNVGVIRVQRIH
jgi:hypothetical protein